MTEPNNMLGAEFMFDLFDLFILLDHFQMTSKSEKQWENV